VGISAAIRGATSTDLSEQPTMSGDAPEQLVDAFKAAALSVTKLYKISASAETKARSDGYQDCLEDMLGFLDREKSGDLGRLRKWVTDRMDGRSDGISQLQESDDDVEKAETASTPEIQRVRSGTPLARQSSPGHARMDSAPPVISMTVKRESEEPELVVPPQDVFSFRSTLAYPSDASLNLANLDLSDVAARNDVNMAPASAVITTPRASRTRHAGNGRSASRQLGRGAGSKRKLNFAEIFDLASLGYPKDMFGNGPGNGKRSRHE
jgi:hypothetical protein